MGEADWGELALVSRVDQWVTAHPYMFIISRARLVRPRASDGDGDRDAGGAQPRHDRSA